MEELEIENKTQSEIAESEREVNHSEFTESGQTEGQKKRGKDFFEQAVDVAKSTSEILLLIPLLLYACQPLIVLLTRSTGFPLSTDNIFWYSSAFGLFAVIARILLNLCLYFPYKGLSLEKVKDFVLSKWEIFALGGAFLWTYIATLNAVKQNVVWTGNWYNEEGFYAVCKYAIIFLSAFLIREEGYKRIFCNALVFSGAVMGAVLLYTNLAGVSFAYHFTRSVYRNSNHYGYALAVSTVASAGLMLTERRKWLKGIYLLCFAILHANMLVSDCFGSFLGEVAGLIVLFVVVILTKNKKEVLIQIAILLAVLVCVSVALESTGVTTLIAESEDVAGDVGDIISGDTDGKEGTNRWGLWTKTLDVIWQVPLFGKGLDCYYSNNLVDGTLDMPHNEYIQLASNVGIIPLVLYFTAIIGVYVRALIRRRELTGGELVCLASAVGYLVSAFFGNTFPYTYPFLLIILGMGMLKTRKKKEEESNVG